MRQKQKNNFSLRLQVVGGNLTAENLKKIAEVAEKYGDGHVHLTSRQSVEIPFVKLDDVEEVKAELAKGGCKPGVCGPRVRTVTACQGNQICPSGNIDSYDIAKKLDARYYARELPHKFKFGVTGCQNNCLKAEENDVGIKGACVVSYDEPSCIMCENSFGQTFGQYTCYHAANIRAKRLEIGIITMVAKGKSYGGNGLHTPFTHHAHRAAIVGIDRSIVAMVDAAKHQSRPTVGTKFCHCQLHTIDGSAVARPNLYSFLLMLLM